MESTFDSLYREINSLAQKYQLRQRGDSTLNGLSVSQTYALEYLYGRSRARMTEIAKYLNVSLSAVTKIIDELEFQSLVTKNINQADQRVANVVISEVGKSFYRKHYDNFINHLSEEFKSLSDANLTSFIVNLKDLNRAISNWRKKDHKEKYKIRKVSPTRPDVKDLIGQLDQHNLSHCPREVCNLLSPEELTSPHCTMLGAFNEDNKLQAIGALRSYDDYGEIKRMFVNDRCRGKGVATKILSQLTLLAKKRGHTVLKLETSEHFKPAVNFYLKSGFVICEAFGEYLDKPRNLYMEKAIVKF